MKKQKMRYKMKINISPIFLDTNAFYDFCYLFGKISIVPACQNKRVNYDLYKKILGASLVLQNLYIPATTIFETISELRNEPIKLKNVLDFLKNIANLYGYHLLNHNRCFEVFGFGYRNTNQIWAEIRNNYEILYNSIEEIVLSKIDSEADVMVLFARIISFTYLIGYHKNTEFYEEAKKEERTLNSYPLGGMWFRHSKNFTARILHSYYLDKEEGKKKKEIFNECLFNVYYRIANTFDFLVENKKEINSKTDFNQYVKKALKERLIEKNDTFTLYSIEQDKKINLQNKMHKWFNSNKDYDEIKKVYEELSFEPGTTDCQKEYIYRMMIDLFGKGKQREKNDTEDFWNLGFSEKNKSFLITFEDEMLDIMKEKNDQNYNFIKNFYKV